MRKNTLYEEKTNCCEKQNAKSESQGKEQNQSCINAWKKFLINQIKI